MFSKQLISTSIRALKASSTPSLTRQSARLVIPTSRKSIQSISSILVPSIRSISSTPLRSDETPQSNSPSPSGQSSYETANLPAVYLSNLSFSVTEELLTEFLKEHTPVKKVDVVRNTDGAARGFGFAKYATQEEAEAAVNVINGLDFLGRQIVAAISQRRPMISDASNQLFMSGFPTQGEADEASLRLAIHERLGVQPRAIRLHKFPGGFLKGTGHLEFDDVATLERVLAKLQEDGSDNPVVVNGHPLLLVKARPLLQPRSRSRGSFDSMRGPTPGGGPAYGAPYGAYGAYPPGPPGGYPPVGGYPPHQAGPGQPGSGYDNSYYPPPPQGPPGSAGYGGYGSQGEGNRGSGSQAY